MTINSQAKGKRAERDLANWWKVNGYPDAARAVKTGTFDTHDAGDLILEYRGFRLCVEVKHHAGGLTDAQIESFGRKLGVQCVQAKANMGILVERRDRVSDPGRWWAHLDAFNFAYLRVPRIEDFGGGLHPYATWEPVRVQLGYLARLLRGAGLAHGFKPVARSASSVTGRSDTAAERPQTVGGS